ncbi:MAG: RNA polymerase factor sigma-54 [Solibacillus sp.]
MNIALNLTQKTEQTLTLEQRNSLEVLQFSNVELERHIYEKANENPLLTVIEPEVAYLSQLLDLATFNKRNDSYVARDQFNFMQTRIANLESPYTFLFEQIPFHKHLTPCEERILKYLIFNLNEKYFLAIELAEVAAVFQVQIQTVEQILKLLHTFEPIGIGARNLREYLLIQIDHDTEAPLLAQDFVRQHLEEIANLSVSFLAKHYKISHEETKNIIQYIRKLNPSPYVAHLDDQQVSQIPDVVVEKIENEWLIHVQHPFRPSIEINHEYVAMLKNSKENATYCKRCLKDALLLMQGIEQRDRTLYSLTNVLLILQQDFFERGIPALKPLKLKDVAQALSLHESTISRAMRHKSIKVPHGVYPFSALFVKGVANQAGELESVNQVKNHIQRLVACENKKKPLSDQQIMTALKTSGFQISRRTVAKYRQELNIPSSSKRIYSIE